MTSVALHLSIRRKLTRDVWHEPGSVAHNLYIGFTGFIHGKTFAIRLG
jgi:hypothetical protein